MIMPPRTDQQLRILLVTPFLPFPPNWGFASRVFHLVDQLAERHRVTVLSYVQPDEGPAADAFAEKCHELVRVPRPMSGGLVKRAMQVRSLISPIPFHALQFSVGGLQKALDELVNREQFDVLHVESSQLGWLRLPRGIPTIVDEHNIESELLGRIAQTAPNLARRIYDSWEFRRYRPFETRVWRSAAGCATTSERDARAIRAACPSLPTAVVANGVDVADFAPSVRPPKGDTIVFTGVLRYRPNLDGISWFLDEVYPRIRAARPGVHLTVVGGGDREALESLRRVGVTVTGWVPDVRPFVAEAAVAVVPLMAGGGTRLKLLEAMSAGKSIVSTTIGAEGVGVHSGTHLLLADDPGTFADEVVRLLGDPALRDRLGQGARDLVCREYQWSNAAAALDDLYRQVLRGFDVEVARRGHA